MIILTGADVIGAGSVFLALLGDPSVDLYVGIEQGRPVF